MPRNMSRINLLIKDIRVERVQDASNQDLINEGIYSEWDGTATWFKNYSNDGPSMFKRDTAKSFASLWDSINAKRGFGWDVNPWVWVVEFEVI